MCVQYNETMSFDRMFDVVDAELGRWMIDNTPIDARIAISTHGSHFRPEMALAGRSIMTSYVGCVAGVAMARADTQRVALWCCCGKGLLLLWL